SDAFRLTRCPRRQHLSADEAQICQCLIAYEKVNHFHLISLARIHRFQSRKQPIDCKVNLNDFKFFPDWRTKADLVGSLGTSDEDVAAPDVPRHPRLAKFALTELRRAREAAGNQRLRRGRD